MPILRDLRPLSALSLAVADGRIFLPFAAPVPPRHREASRRATARHRHRPHGRPGKLSTRIERVRFETMTLWQRMTFENRPPTSSARTSSTATCGTIRSSRGATRAAS